VPPLMHPALQSSPGYPYLTDDPGGVSFYQEDPSPASRLRLPSCEDKPVAGTWVFHVLQEADVERKLGNGDTA